MIPIKQLTLLGLVATGGFVLTGCGTGVNSLVLTAPPSLNAPPRHYSRQPDSDPAPLDIETSRRYSRNVPYTSKRTDPTREMYFRRAQTVREDASGVLRPPAMRPGSKSAQGIPTNHVGIFGELAGNARITSKHFADGSTNVAQVTFATEGMCMDPDIDPTGQYMVFSSTMHRPVADIYIKSVNGTTHTQLTNDPSADIMPAFSPKGNMVAFASNRGGNWDIYIMSLESRQAIKITSDMEDELHPTWSPDGRTISYCRFSQQSNRWEIWVVDVNNHSRKQFLVYGLFPEWSPDPNQNKLLFQRARERGSRFFSVWTVDFDSGEAMRETEIVSAANAAVINPTWSADGQRIAFVTVVEPDSNDDRVIKYSDVWVVDVKGTNRFNLTNGDAANYQPVWSKDGRVYFVSNRAGVDNVWSAPTSRAMTMVRTLQENAGEAMANVASDGNSSY